MNLPRVGFGCSPFRPGGRRIDVEGAVRAAIRLGCRLYDVAELYGNERAVGRALHGEAAPQRGELVVIGKVWRTNFRPADLRRACESSLGRLGLDRFDLYLLHAPEAWRHRAPLEDPEQIGWTEFERRALPRDGNGAIETDGVEIAETWGAMAELVRHGLAAGIGVSNFAAHQIETLWPPPAANQIAHSPYAPQAEVVRWCSTRGIDLQAHSPLAAPGLLSEPALVELGASRRRSPAQIVLRWNVQRGLVPLFSSTDPGHIAENLQVLDFELDPDAMAVLDRLAKPDPSGSSAG